MSDLTPVTEEVTPPSAETVQPSDKEPTETVEELKARLAAAEEEAKRWKNRVAEENPKKEKGKPTPVSEEDMNWAIANNPRIELVKDTYEKELKDLEALGAKITNAAKTKALENAERHTGVSKPAVDASDDSPPPSVSSINRSVTKTVKMTETDKAFGIKPETKAKYPMNENTSSFLG